MRRAASTVGGWFLSHYNQIPKAGDHLTVDNWRLEVVGMDSNRGPHSLDRHWFRLVRCLMVYFLGLSVDLMSLGGGTALMTCIPSPFQRLWAQANTRLDVRVALSRLPASLAPRLLDFTREFLSSAAAGIIITAQPEGMPGDHFVRRNVAQFQTMGLIAAKLVFVENLTVG